MTRLSLEPPSGWELLEAEEPAVAVAAAPEQPGGAFRPNLVVTVTGTGLEGGLEELVDAAIEQQRAGVPGFHLIDRHATELAGLACVRTLAHSAAGGLAVVVEQWRLLADGSGHELTASCATFDYPELADTFAAAAASLHQVAG